MVAVNDTRKRAMARKVLARLEAICADKTIAILGLTFKPNTDDMREAPSIAVDHGAAGPGREFARMIPRAWSRRGRTLEVTYCDGPIQLRRGADALVIVTEWEQFRALDLERLNIARSEATKQSRPCLRRLDCSHGDGVCQ